MKKVLVNLKMYQTSKEEVEKYINDLKGENVILFPSFIYLEKYIENGFICGAQNISTNDVGAYTSEISAKSLKNLNVKYVLIGHSEVRKNFNEKEENINLKIKKALEYDLTPVLCVGETLEEYNNQKTKEVIKEKLIKDLDNIKGKVIISYEPIWAIGTGKIPKKEEIENIVKYIKTLTHQEVLYGGSVSLDNIENLNQIDVDGFLIGKAGLDVSCLKKIIEVVSR